MTFTGIAKTTLLVRLNASALNSRRTRSPSGNCLNKEKSMFAYPSDRKELRPESPNVKGGGTAKALVLNHAAGVGCGRVGSATRFARTNVLPTFARSPS